MRWPGASCGWVPTRLPPAEPCSSIYRAVQQSNRPLMGMNLGRIPLAPDKERMSGRGSKAEVSSPQSEVSFGSNSGHCSRGPTNRKGAPPTVPSNSGAATRHVVGRERCNPGCRVDTLHQCAPANAVAARDSLALFRRTQAGLRTEENPSHKAIEPSAKLPRMRNIAL
jgi:hypothetical protein